jgi:regulator of RNase E activity RraA
VADDTGVVFIPQGFIAEVVGRAIEASRKEGRLIDAIQAGSSMEEIKKILSPDKW